MTDQVTLNFELAVRHSLEQVFDPDELAEDNTLEVSVGPVHRAFILVFSEWSQPTHPHLPEPTLKLQDGSDVFYAYLFSEVEARGGEVVGEVVFRRPSENAQKRPVEASERWGYVEGCQSHLRRLTGARKQSGSIPNPLLGYAKVLSASHKLFSPVELYHAYRNIAAYNKEHSVEKAGQARGAQRKREVEIGTIPKIEFAIECLIEEGEKPTQKAVAERAGLGIATIKRHWNHDRVVKARKCH